LQHVCILLWLLTVFGFADDARPSRFDVHTADGTDTSGIPEKISEDWTITLGGGEGVIGKAGALIALRRQGQALPASPLDEHLLFMNGDKLPGHLLDLVNERVRVDAHVEPLAPTGRQEVTVPLTALAALWFTEPTGVNDVERFRRQLPRERRRHDRVFLRNGDRLEGDLTKIDHDALIIEVEKKPIKLERDRVAVVALNTEFARVLKPRATYGRLILMNGGRLSIAALQGDGQTWTGKLLFGGSLQIPVEQIVALDLAQGRALSLADLKPTHFEHRPYFGVSWPYEVDGAVTGQDLRLGGSSHDKGIGMHSESRLTYDLAGSYDWFETLVGIDDRAGSGSARVEVLVDGKAAVLGINPELVGGSSPRSIRVPVAGARELTLVAKFGRQGDVLGHVDWADVRLIKTPGAK
jgi:hypothetical protein